MAISLAYHSGEEGGLLLVHPNEGYLPLRRLDVDEGGVSTLWTPAPSQSRPKSLRGMYHVHEQICLRAYLFCVFLARYKKKSLCVVEE